MQQSAKNTTQPAPGRPRLANQSILINKSTRKGNTNE